MWSLPAASPNMLNHIEPILLQYIYITMQGRSKPGEHAGQASKETKMAASPSMLIHIRLNFLNIHLRVTMQGRSDEESMQAKLQLSEAKLRLSAESDQRLQEFSEQVEQQEAVARKQMQEESRSAGLKHQMALSFSASPRSVD